MFQGPLDDDSINVAPPQTIVHISTCDRSFPVRLSAAGKGCRKKIINKKISSPHENHLLSGVYYLNILCPQALGKWQDTQKAKHASGIYLGEASTSRVIYGVCDPLLLVGVSWAGYGYSECRTETIRIEEYSAERGLGKIAFVWQLKSETMRD